jgi:hypothetical protein
MQLLLGRKPGAAHLMQRKPHAAKMAPTPAANPAVASPYPAQTGIQASLARGSVAAPNDAIDMATL